MKKRISFEMRFYVVQSLKFYGLRISETGFSFAILVIGIAEDKIADNMLIMVISTPCLALNSANGIAMFITFLT